jgi:hypothetical protein
MMEAMNDGGEQPTSKADTPANADPVHSEANAQDSALNETSAANGGLPSNAPSKTSSSRNSSPAAPASENQQSAQDSNDTPSAMDLAQQSRDVASTEPGSARPSRKESEEAAAAPYGTRSRNRPGRSRINYAEDTEMDFEMTAAPSNGNASDPSSRNSAAAERGQSPAVGGKKGANAGQGSAPWGSSGPSPTDPANANIPGTSAFTAANQPATAQPATKRRKNAAKDATNGVHVNSAAPSPAAAKRGAQPTAAVSGSRENNMMSFENTGAMLKNGHLEADDGQTVSVNGEFFHFSLLQLTAIMLRQSRLTAWLTGSNWMSRPTVPCVRAARRALLSLSNYGIHTCQQ